MNIEEYKKRKQAGTIQFRKEGRAVVAITTVFDPATGLPADTQEKRMSKEAIENRIDALLAEVDSLQELLADIDTVLKEKKDTP